MRLAGEGAVSKSRIGIVVVIVLAALMPDMALGRGRGLHLGPLGAVRSVFGRILPLRAGRFHRGHSYAHHHGHIRNAAVPRSEQSNQSSQGSQDDQDNTGSPPQAGEEREGSLLDKPAARAQIVAAAALAGWHDGRAANGWWRHGDDDYGWVGPLFWPFAYDDIYSYVIFGNSVGFWDYGYADIFAGMFAPYGQQDLAAYLDSDPSGQRHRKIPPLQQFCGDDSREIAGLPVERIAQAIQPNDAQRAALDELADASINATRMIRASCPTQMVLTAPARLAVMGQRIETLIKAELALQPPLDKLFDALDDEQKARLNELADDQRKTAVANGADEAPAQACQGPQPGTLQWQGDEIAARLHPNDTQRAALDVLQAASARALDMLNDVCQPGEALTAPARLAALDRRLDAMQHAVRLVSDALEDFYATLDDEQKAQFEAIGPRRTS